MKNLSWINHVLRDNRAIIVGDDSRQMFCVSTERAMRKGEIHFLYFFIDKNKQQREILRRSRFFLHFHDLSKSDDDDDRHERESDCDKAVSASKHLIERHFIYFLLVRRETWQWIEFHLDEFSFFMHSLVPHISRKIIPPSPLPPHCATVAKRKTSAELLSTQYEIWKKTSKNRNWSDHRPWNRHSTRAGSSRSLKLANARILIEC